MLTRLPDVSRKICHYGTTGDWVSKLPSQTHEREEEHYACCFLTLEIPMFDNCRVSTRGLSFAMGAARVASMVLVSKQMWRPCLGYGWCRHVVVCNDDTPHFLLMCCPVPAQRLASFQALVSTYTHFPNHTGARLCFFSLTTTLPRKHLRNTHRLRRCQPLRLPAAEHSVQHPHPATSTQLSSRDSFRS